MTKKVHLVEEDEPMTVDILTLLNYSNALDENVQRQRDEEAREQAKEEHGLVEPSAAKGAKVAPSKVEAQLRAENEELKASAVTLAEAHEQIVADLNNTITERDEQIARLISQLEADNVDPATAQNQGQGEKAATASDSTSVKETPKVPVTGKPWDLPKE